MMSSIDIRAILLATLAVFGIDFFSSWMLFAAYGGPMSGTQEQVKSAVEAMTREPGYLRAVLVLGTASTIVGGWLVARIARRIPYFNALAYGLLSVVLSALLSDDLPTWVRVVGIALTLPAALLGAYFGKRPLSK
ncbi:MAG TPA: hypothetical protein VJS12_02975 [Steroidobacteraceae bacterium]|nr:hypothetical protein [Steroidobacteraceae bacterium]